MIAEDDNSFEEWLSAGQGHWEPVCASDVMNAILMNVNTNNANEDKWKATPPEYWSYDDFLNFLYHRHSLDEYDITVEALPGEEFLKEVSSTHGGNICQMTLNDFLKIDSRHGHLLYNRLQGEIRKHLKTFSSDCAEQTARNNKNDVTMATAAFHTVWQLQLLPKPVEDFIYQDVKQATTLSCDSTAVGLFDYTTMSRQSPVLTDEVNASDPNEELFELRPFLHQQADNCCFHTSKRIDSGSQPELPTSRSYQTNQCMSHVNCQSGGPRRLSLVEEPQVQQQHGLTSSSVTPNDVTRRSSPAKRRQSTRSSEHLWLFLYRQLQEHDEQSQVTTKSETKEKIIRWEERSRGIFRILDSHAVAEMWSKRKHNRRKPMTFEKLARAIRWGKAEGFFASVPKNGRFPKKLCYRFGEKATSVWNDA